MKYSMMILLLIYFILTYFLMIYLKAQELTNVIIFGSTGNLAKKYLWNAMFHLYLSKSNDQQFLFYGSSRMSFVTGQQELSNIISSLNCEEINCQLKMKQFASLVQYVALPSDDEYSKFCSKLNLSNAGEHEFGRLFYFSVPPFAYIELAQKVNKYCRPPSVNTWIRIVLEKPFGKDFSSAEEMSSKLLEYFREDEIYRVDHYLGKPLVKAILPFRFYNQDIYEKLWNRHHIEKVEIVMKETDSVLGRIHFFDNYGIIRDVMQNHLTELLILIAMELPHSLEDIAEIKSKKLELLANLQPPTFKKIVIGQYDDYRNQAQRELNDGSYVSKTPTFAAAVLHIDNTRWQDVPFIITAGKSMELKENYIKIVFKNYYFCNSDSKNNCNLRQIIFHMGFGEINFPSILVTTNLPAPQEFLSWNYTDICKDVIAYNLKLSKYKFLTSYELQDAYSTLVFFIFKGNRDFFVGTEHLLSLWKVWTPLLQATEAQKPRSYNQNESGWLDFMLVQNKLQYVNQAEGLLYLHSEDNVLQSSFKERKVLTGNLEAISFKLASQIITSAQRNVKEKGSFHLVLPGGSSPERLYKILVDLKFEISWEYTHIWFLDERCVSLDDVNSNFRNVYNNLLKFIPIPYINIHPMPVMLSSGLCESGDRGFDLYDKTIKNFTDGYFDFIVVGVGSDGHVASLFPNQKGTLNVEKFVILTEMGISSNLNKRMTLTFSCINKSKEIVLLIVGKNKKQIVQQLQSNTDENILPVSEIAPENGNLTLYIDNSAL